MLDKGEDMAENPCNCWIGMLDDNTKASDELFFHLDDYIVKCVRFEEELHWDSGYKAEDVIDRRRTFFRFFDFCPVCGNKIDWKTLRKALRACVAKPRIWG